MSKTIEMEIISADEFLDYVPVQHFQISGRV